MAVSRKKSKEAAEAPAKRESKDAAKSQSQLRDEERRQKVLEGFHPDVIAFFKDKLGVDLNKLSTGTLYDLQTGKLTEPLEIVVTPLAYDKESKQNVEMPRIKAFTSLKVNLPYEGGKPVAPDTEKHRIFVVTVPCRPMAEKNVESAVPALDGEESTKRENPSFTEDQLLALEGIGIDRSRLYGGFNHISKEVKCAAADGEPFYVDGSVKTDFGPVNIIGEAQLGMQDGKAVASFDPFYPVEQSEEKTVDLLEARINGAMELDFFRRRPDGQVMTDVNGVPKFNDAYYNLKTFGNAMEPVLGKIHRRNWNAQEGKFVETVETGRYQVSVAPAYRVYDPIEKKWKVFDQGNLVITPMKEIKYKKGEDVAVRYEVSQARVKDGKVFVDGQGNAPLEFINEKEFENYMAGRGGVVKDAKYHDFTTKSDVVYNAFVAPDNTRAGYARQFSPATTKKILERREQKTGMVRTRKTGYGIA